MAQLDKEGVAYIRLDFGIFRGKGFNKAANNEEMTSIYRAVSDVEIEKLTQKGLSQKNHNEIKPKYFSESIEDAKMHLEEGDPKYNRTKILEFRFPKKLLPKFQNTGVNTDGAEGKTYTLDNKFFRKLNHFLGIKKVDD